MTKSNVRRAEELSTDTNPETRIIARPVWSEKQGARPVTGRRESRFTGHRQKVADRWLTNITFYVNLL